MVKVDIPSIKLILEDYEGHQNIITVTTKNIDEFKHYKELIRLFSIKKEGRMPVIKMEPIIEYLPQQKRRKKVKVMADKNPEDHKNDK